MLHDARTSLTKAVVIGPGRAVLFYGRHSMGEDLTKDEAKDATFLFTEVGTWVGKPAYLAANPMTIQEGQWANAQAITDCQVKVRGPGHPCVNLLTQQPFRFDHTRGYPQTTPLGRLVLMIDHHHLGPPEAEITIDVGGTKGHHYLGCHHLPQTVGLKVTGVHYWLPCQCCPGWIDPRDLNVPDMGDSIKKMEPIWR